MSDLKDEHSINADVMSLSYGGLVDIDITYHLYEKPTAVHMISEHENYVVPALKRKLDQGRIALFINKNPQIQHSLKGAEFIEKYNLIVINSKLRKRKDIIRLLSLYEKLPISQYCGIQIRGSLFTTVYLARLMKYEEVLLVGFDLNGSDYFFKNSDKEEWKHFSDPYELDAWRPAKGYHFTSDPSTEQPIQDVVGCLASIENFQIYNYSSESLLTETFYTPEFAEFENLGFFTLD